MDESIPTPTPELQFHAIKSNYFRVIYAEGAVGGISPRGMIQMAIFNERAAIPKLTVHEALATGGGLVPGKEISEKRDGKSGIVRELEAEIIMSLQSAKAFHSWLGMQIDKVDQSRKNATPTTNILLGE